MHIGMRAATPSLGRIGIRQHQLMLDVKKPAKYLEYQIGRDQRLQGTFSCLKTPRAARLHRIGRMSGSTVHR
jgi:hypothetical protein